MRFSQSLFLIPSLAWQSRALPTADGTSVANPYVGVGLPAGGVNCQTDKEDLHNLTNAMIQTTMSNGASILQLSHGTNKQDDGTNVYFPALFNQQAFMNPSWPALNVPAACNLSQPVYYMPLWYPGTTQPDTTGKGTSPTYPGYPLTTDIVVFTAVLQGGFLATGNLQFCAVLTNSDVLQNGIGVQALFAGETGHTYNPNPSGYRQCTANS